MLRLIRQSAGPRWSVAAVLLTATIAAALRAVAAEPAAPVARDGMLLLKSGEVLAGRITTLADRYQVVLPGAELSLKTADVEAVCRTLDECYRTKRAGIGSGDADGHLQLAQWCLRQRLTGYAAAELAEAVAINPQHPQAEMIERRITQAMTAASGAETAPAEKEDNSRANQELDRLVRGMPRGSVETFTNSVQPLLMNSCATAGCHGPNSTTKFSMQRMLSARTANRHVTQRNLQIVLQLIDRQEPSESPLLTMSLKPHGGMRAAIFNDHQTARYRQLVDWVNLVTGDGGAALGDVVRADGSAAARTGTAKSEVVPVNYLQSNSQSPAKAALEGMKAQKELDAATKMPQRLPTDQPAKPLPTQTTPSSEQPPSVTLPPDPAGSTPPNAEVVNHRNTRWR